MNDFTDFRPYAPGSQPPNDSPAYGSTRKRHPKQALVKLPHTITELSGPAFTPAMLVMLGEKDVKTLDDLADLASDELIEILGADAMDETTANDVIMAARAHWFADGDAPGDVPGDASADAVEQVQEAGHD